MRPAECLLSMTSHLRFGFAGLWGKNWRQENKARSPQASEATGSHLGLDVGLRAAEASKHERHRL